MEQLSLLEFNDIRRPTKGKELTMSRLPKVSSFNMNTRMESCIKATLLIG